MKLWYRQNTTRQHSHQMVARRMVRRNDQRRTMDFMWAKHCRHHCNLPTAKHRRQSLWRLTKAMVLLSQKSTFDTLLANEYQFRPRQRHRPMENESVRTARRRITRHCNEYRHSERANRATVVLHRNDRPVRPWAKWKVNGMRPIRCNSTMLAPSINLPMILMRHHARRHFGFVTSLMRICWRANSDSKRSETTYDVKHFNTYRRNHFETSKWPKCAWFQSRRHWKNSKWIEKSKLRVFTTVKWTNY